MDWMRNEEKEAIYEDSKSFVLNIPMGGFANNWNEKDCVWRLVIAFVHVKLKISIWPLGAEIGPTGWGGVGFGYTSQAFKREV